MNIARLKKYKSIPTLQGFLDRCEGHNDYIIDTFRGHVYFYNSRKRIKFYAGFDKKLKEPDKKPVKKKKAVIDPRKMPCNHSRIVVFRYMDGYYCHTCKDSFLNGRWTTKRRRKRKKKNKK